MYRNIITSERIDGKRSEEFEVKVRVRQGSVLCLLLLATVTDENSKEKENDVNELLYAHDLVLLGESWEKVQMR